MTEPPSEPEALAPPPPERALEGAPAEEVEPVRAASAASAAAVEALIRANRRRGVDPSWDTASCRWKRSDDIPLDVLEKAEEAA